MNQVKMKMALRGDFLEQCGFNKSWFGPLLMKILCFRNSLFLAFGESLMSDKLGDLLWKENKKEASCCYRFDLPLTNRCLRINHLVINSKCNTIEQNWWSHTFKRDAKNICVIVGTHVVPCRLQVSSCLVNSSTILQLVINGPWVHVQNKRSRRLIICMCATSSDDSNNHVGGVGVSGHNKHVSPKTSSGRVFVFFLKNYVFVSLFTSSWVYCYSPIQGVLLKAKCKCPNIKTY